MSKRTNLAHVQNYEVDRLCDQRQVNLDGNAEFEVTPRVADRPKGLLSNLMVKAGLLAALPPVPVKRGRGRPLGSKNGGSA